MISSIYIKIGVCLYSQYDWFTQIPQEAQSQKMTNACQEQQINNLELKNNLKKNEKQK